MDQETIIAGVSPGGFKDVYEVRILICYLLDSVHEPLSKDQLNFIIQENHLVNYFTYAQAVAELLEERHLSLIEQNGDECYRLNELGADTSKMLQHSLPRSVRDRVVSTAMELLSQQKKERENEVTIKPMKQGFNVTFVLHDTDIDLLRFTLFVPDEMQAQTVKETFLKDPTGFYTTVIHSLTGDM